MPLLNFESIYKDLSEKKYHPLYFFSGEESFFIDYLCHQIEEKVLMPEEKEFNLSILYGRDTNLREVLSSAKRYPMMADYQVIIVKEAQNLDHWDLLVEYMKHPVPTSILVFAYKNKKLDKRTSFAKAIEKEAIVLEAKKLNEGELYVWIEKYLKARRYSISHKANQLLIENLGNNLQNIVNELGKLMLNLKEGHCIEDKDIEEQVGFSKDYNIFELQRALSSKDTIKANKIIHYFIANAKDFPLQMIIPMLYSFFSKLFIYHGIVKKMPRKDIMTKMGIPSFALPEYEKAALVFSFPKTAQIIEILHQYDLRSKGVNNVSTPPEELLKEMMFKILHA